MTNEKIEVREMTAESVEKAVEVFNSAEGTTSQLIAKMFDEIEFEDEK